MARTDLLWRRCARAFGACAVAGALSLSLGAAAPARASGIHGYNVTEGDYSSRVFDIAQASNHVMWFTKTDAHTGRAAIGRLDTRGKPHTTAIPWQAGQLPPMLARGQQGSMWFTAGGRLGRINPDGVIASFPLPTPGAIAEDLASGSDGDVWFVETVPPNSWANKDTPYIVGRMDASGQVTEYPVGTAPRGWPPSTIVRGLDGAMWFTEGTGKVIGRIGPDGRVTRFSLPGFCSGYCQPDSISAGNGGLWFANVHGGRLGRITTSGQLRSFRLRGTGSHQPLRAITIGPDKAVWFAISGFVGRRTSNGRVTRWGLGRSQGGAIPTRITSGPSRTVWVATYTTLYRVPVGLRKGSHAGNGGGGSR